MASVEYPADPVLLVDDEPAWLMSASALLRSEGITNLLTCSDSTEALGLLSRVTVSLVTIDLNMPGLHGEALLEAIVRDFPGAPVIVVTGMNQVDAAVRCMKLGAYDFFVKSTETERLLASVRRACRMSELAQENRALKERLMEPTLRCPEAFADIVTGDRRMLALFHYIEAVAVSPRPVLILGESGAGKELIARAIHRLSGRTGPFVAVNSAGLDDQMCSDMLFGHRMGAYTGAVEARAGLVETARDGTLFLDEIGDMHPASQAKLLRLLQENEYLPLGADLPRKSNARVVAATNQNLQASQTFRKDLFYRLGTHTMTVPPLRERKDDIPRLLEHFLEKSAKALDKPTPTPPPQLLALLRSYSFPGNIRELESMVFDAVSRHSSRMLSMDAFKEYIGGAADYSAGDAATETEAAQEVAFPDPLPTLRQMTELLAREALSRASGNQAIAAQMLGITRQALNSRLRKSRC